VRVAVVYSYYPAYLRRVYGAEPGLRSLPYEEQHAALMRRLFAQADAYSQGLGELGVPAVDLVANCEPLQLQWLREHGDGLTARRAASRLLKRMPGLSGEGLQKRVLLGSIVQAQIRSFDADIVLAQSLTTWSRRELASLRAEGRLVVGQIASAPPPVEVLRCFDLLLSSFPHFVDWFRSLGIDSEYLRHFFYASAIDAVEETGVSVDPRSDRAVDVSFVGGVNPAVHGSGTTTMEEICRRIPVEVWGYGGEALPEGSAIRSRWRGESWGVDMYRLLARSKITLNRHIDLAQGHANNMRLYEATGMGSLLLTEDAPNLGQQFEPGTEVETYRDVDELTDKVARLLESDEERVRIAAAGHRRTLRDHTHHRRMAELVEILEVRR
jgi:spore maturation protein CgeB